MSATSRSAFVARVAAAVRSGNRFREAARPDIVTAAAFSGSGAALIDRLTDELIRVGVYVQRVTDEVQAHAAIRAVVERYAIRRAVRNADPVFDDLGIDALLRELGVEVVLPSDLASLDEPARRDRLFAADLGIAASDWAIAETGTLVYAAGPEQTRSATLLPPVHLAVVDAARVLADLVDLPARLAERFVDGVLPRNVALVTGPSKTGDIELKLTTGVHGPGEVHVLISE